MLLPIDYLLIGLYFLLILFVGIYSARKQSSDDYLIASRSLNAAVGTTTIFSSELGAGVILTYIALVYLYGLGAIWYFIGAAFGYLVFYFFALKIKTLADEKKYYTMPDFFFDKMGPFSGYLVTLIVFLIMFGWVVVNFTGGATLISQYTEIRYETSILVMGVIILIYLFIGGFKSVVATDVIQSIGISLFFVLMLYLLFFSGQPVRLEELTFSSIPIFDIISFFLAGFLIPLGSPELWQRVYAIKDRKQLKKSMVYASFSYIAIGVVLLFIGLVIRSRITDLNPDTALIVGFSQLLPAGMAGLSVIILYSAITSSADTYLFTSNASLNQDFLLKAGFIRKENLLKVMKVLMVLLTLLGMALSILIRGIVETTFFFVSITMSLGFLILMIWIFPGINKHSVNLAMLFSFCGVLVPAILIGISTDLILYSFAFCLLVILSGWVWYRFLEKQA